MNTTRLKQARRLFVHQDADASTARHNMRQWVKSIRHLGGNWLLAQKVGRLS